MSDSENEFVGRKKQCQPFIDSEDDEHDEKPPDSASQSSSQTADFNVASGADAAQPTSSSLNGEKSGRLSPSDNVKCASDNESSASQSSSQVRSQSSLPDRNSQSSISQSSPIGSCKRKSSSNSDSSDSDNSCSTIVSNKKSSRRSTKRLSPGSRSSSQSSNTTLVSNRNLNNTKSSAASSDSDSCSETDQKTHDTSITNRRLSNEKSPAASLNSDSHSEAESKAHDSSPKNRILNSKKSSVASSDSDSCSETESKVQDTSVNSIESSGLPNEKSDHVSDSENLTKPKAKKYKLLSDDDLSEDEEHHPPVKHSDIESDENLNPKDRSKLKKDKRKKKLQMLNQLKRKELKEKSGNVSSDSESENHGTFAATNDKQSNSSRVSSDNSAASDSEAEKVKSKAKVDRKSLPQRKSKKVDPKLEIKSKTQKMIRENRISLPYHQPKKRSLDEFLARRKNTPSIPLKATDDVLHVVSEHLLKREKEVEVFYKSESDHSDDGGKDTVEEITKTPTHELQVPENLLEKSTVLVNNATLENDDFAAELENDVEIQDNSDSTKNVVPEIPENSDSTKNVPEILENSNSTSLVPEIQENVESSKNVPADVHNCGQGQSSSASERVSADCESSLMDLDMPVVKERESSDQLMIVGNSSAAIETVSGVINTDLTNHEDPHMTKSMSSPSPREKSTETSEAVIENPEENSISELPVTENDVQQNSVGSDEAISRNLESPPKENEAEENFSAISKSEEPLQKDSEQPDTDDFDLIIEDSSASKQSGQNNAEPPDTDDFDLMIQDSCNDSEKNKNDGETITPEPAADLRSKKLALLSRLKIPLRTDIKLQASPDMVIELETPTIAESEFGVYELKKKFAFHSSMRTAPVRKTSTKLSIIRTETDSQGEIVDVVKEIIDIDCGEIKKDEEKEKFSVPGAKHLNFKEHMLKSLIERKRAKWQEYQEEKRKLCGTQSSDEEDFDEFSDKPDFEPYHPEDELDDDELEEDDVEIKEKKTMRNDFVDDEAEVSFDEDENLKESDNEDEESEKETETEETAADVDHESADDEADVEADSDEEMLSSKKETTEPSQPSTEIFKKPLPSQVFPIFKYNTTGTDLENKVLGFENIFEEKHENPDVGSTQLFEICSGKFATQVERLNSSDPSDSEFFMDSQHGEDSQNINLSLQDTNDGFHFTDTQTSDNRSLLFLSDESDTEELFARKKKLMRLDDSDDEKDTPAPVDDVKSDEDENNDVKDGVNDEDEEEPNDEEDADEVDAFGDDEDELAYNSEEEIITKQKAAEFFENEAELSESEWGSEDENEQNLDELEKEAGDDDVLDEEELKKELGKIHMRQLLDDDQNDVRMLKEMLLEDGDLHSDGKRQRKFQWTNLDDNGFFSKMTNESDEEVLNEDDEEEVDTNWRKIRHEREMFISQQEKREDLLEEAEDETSDSLPVPKANASNEPAKSSKPSVVTNNNISSPDLKLPFKARFKCGSFLTRNKMILDRLAVTVGECKENVTGKAKNHRNFVFAAVSPEKELPNVPEIKTEKRKISSKSVMARKKLKLTSTNQRGLLAQLALSE